MPSSLQVDQIQSADGVTTYLNNGTLSNLTFPSGHIIQTENIATTSTFTPAQISAGTFVDSGFSDTITPKRTDSKLLVNFCGTVSANTDVWIYIALQFSGSSITTQTVGESGTTPLVRANPRTGSGDALCTSSFTVLQDVNQSNNTDAITVKIRLGANNNSYVTLGERQSNGSELMTTMTIQEVMP